jgi:hypothetical protein
LRAATGNGPRQRVPVVRATTPLPELLTDHKTQFNQPVECPANLADSEGQEGQSLGEVGNQFTGRESGEGCSVHKGTGGTSVAFDDTDPEGDLLKAE